MEPLTTPAPLTTTTTSPSEDPLATTLFRSPITNIDADVIMESPQHKPSLTNAPQYEIAMEQLPWPDWPAVRLRSITHFNRFVKPRDRTRELIADHLATTPYAQPVKPVRPPTPPPSPAEIAEKRLTKIRRKIEEEWPDVEPSDDATVDHLGKVVKKAKASTEIEEYRMEVTPALMNALGHEEDAAALALEKASVVVSPEPSTEDVSDEDDVVDDRVSHLLEDALDRKVHEMLTEEAGESDEDLVAFVIHLAREADDREGFMETLKAQGAAFRDDFAKELYQEVERYDAPKAPKMALVEEQVMLSGDAQAQLAAEGALERFENENEDPSLALERFHESREPAIPDSVCEEFKGFIDRDPARRLEVDEVRHEGRLTAEAIREAREAARDLDAEDLEIVGDHRELDPIAVSSEMELRLAHTISTNLGNDLHRDRVNSVLAPPLSSESVYCHADLQQGLPGAIVAFDGGEDGTSNELETRHLQDADLRRRAKWEQAVGEWHAQQGNSVDAYQHFGKAASLYEKARFTEGPPGKVNAQDVFVYDAFAIKAINRIQRYYRRHHELLGDAFTKCKALYRGSVVRDGNRRYHRRLYAAAVFAQKPCRRWYARRWNNAIHLERCERGRKARRIAWLIRRERELRWKLAFFMKRCIAKIRARIRRGRIWGATTIQRVWRGGRGRAAFADELQRYRARRLKAATMAQTVARRARARARARIRERELVKAEALRLAAERKLVKRAAALAELRTALKLEAPSSSGPALKFWAARLRSNDEDDAATEEVDEKKAREAFAAGAHDGTVMKSENLQEALAAAGLSRNESDVAAALGELGGKAEITFPDFAHWLATSGKRRKPRLSLLKRLFAKKPKVDLAAAIQRRAAGEARRDAARRAARRAVNGLREDLGHPRFACGACHATFALQKDFVKHFDRFGNCSQAHAHARPHTAEGKKTRKRAFPFHMKSIVVSAKEHRARANCLRELGRLEDEERVVNAAGRDAYAQARHALDVDQTAKRELGLVIRGLRKVIKKRLKAEAELRDIVDALDARGLLDARCARGLFRAMRAGDVEPGSLKWRDADEVAAAAARAVLALKEALPGADTLVSAGDLITWWRTGGRSTGLSTTALKTPDTVRALAKDVLARRAEAAARAQARRDFRGERPPLRNVGFDEDQLKAHDLRHLSAVAVDRRARSDEEGEARCAAAAAALVRKGQEKKKRTTKVAPEKMNLDDMSSDDEEDAPGAPAPAQQPPDGAVSQREAEKILAEAEQRLEDECREMLTTPHGRDALVFEAARLQAAAWLEDGGTEDQKLAASAARCFDAGSDGIVDGRDLPELIKYATGDLSEADHAWMFERKDGLIKTDDVVTYLCQRKGLVERSMDATMALIARARHRARDRHRAHDVKDDLRRARRNALDHLVENACLRAHACRDAEHKVRILSSTRRGLARLEWDACNHEAMRDHYFARATSLSKEDAALEEAAYVFAWFDVEHSGVLDTHEACPKFLLAFGCCATWPEALVATRDAAPGKAEVSWPVLKRFLVAHRPERLSQGWRDVKPGSELDRAVLAARVEAIIKLRQALAAERRAERAAAKRVNEGLVAFSEARHAKNYSFVGDLVRAAHAEENKGPGDATEAARRKLERAAYHAEADARRFLATTAGQRALRKREEEIVARRRNGPFVEVDGLPPAAAIAINDVWQDSARTKDNTVDRAELSRVVHRLIKERGVPLEGDVSAALAPTRVVADPELLAHRAAIKDSAVRKLLHPDGDKAAKKELGRLAKRKMSLLLSLAVHHDDVKDRGGRAPDASRCSRAEFDAWCAKAHALALTRNVLRIMNPKAAAPRHCALQSILAHARSDARDSARDVIAREHLGVQEHVVKPHHAAILHRCAVLSAFATADVEHFLKSAAGKGVLKRRADALAILAPPWVGLIEDEMEDEDLRYLRHMAWRLFSAHVVGDANGIDRHEAPHVRLPSARLFRKCGLHRACAIDSLAAIGDTFGHEEGLMTFDQFWQVISGSQSSDGVDPPSIREFFDKKPTMKQLARTHVEAEARQHARKIARMERDHREHHAPPVFANVYVK